MALKPCPHCGNHISDKAKRCPKCGAELSEKDFDKNVNIQQEEETPLESFDYNEEPSPRNKRWMMIVLPIIIIALVAGGGFYFFNEKKKSEAAALAEQIRQDSILAAQKEAERLEQLRQDSIAWVNFTTPDLSFFELHGHVKSVEGDINEVRSHPNDRIKNICFDENGKLIIESSGSFNSKYCGKIGWKISRDKEDRIISISYNSYEGLNGYPYSKKFKWEDNKIVKIDIYAFYGNTHIKYEYGSNGILEKEIWDLREEEQTEEFIDFINKKITDYQFDKYGNWISRKVDKKIQTRQITYYED